MGTNYYLKKNHCAACNRVDSKHIGSSVRGWCFKLHVYPCEGIHDLDDWKREFAKGVIHDDCDREMSIETMLAEITDRKAEESQDWIDYKMRSGNSIKGPNGLLRHKKDDQFCIGHGEGTWDYLIGDFQ